VLMQKTEGTGMILIDNFIRVKLFKPAILFSQAGFYCPGELQQRMKKKEPAHITHYYFRRLYKYSEGMKDGFNEEAIHRFRVEFKKLRAFLRMMALAVSKPRQLKLPHAFKNMYSLAGKIRDRQLCLKKIKDNKENNRRSSAKMTFLKKEIKDLSARKDVFLTKRKFEEIEKDMIKELPLIVQGTFVKDFIRQKLDFISEIIAKGDYRDKELHSIRKSLKDITYVTKIFKEDLKIRMPAGASGRIDLKKAESLSHDLGLFNDAGIALSFFELSEIKKAGAKEKESLLSVRRKWLSEKRELKKDILKHIPEIKLTTG
jgi:CHAD domain-containing protein